jgi:phosphopantothenoylcysteine decarboxylase / phosphopantothenate---cysteine ligase
MTDWFVRRSAVSLARGDSYLLVDPDHGASALEGVDVEAFAAVLALAAQPVSRERLLELAGEEAIARLVELGVLAPCAEPAPAPPPAAATARRCGRLVIGLCGTVSVSAALDFVVPLADVFAREVELVFTRGARRFVRPRIFEYRGLRTWDDAFAPRHGAAVPHHHLATSADLVLIAPASAGTLARLARGACDDLLSLIVAATTAPVVIAPSMNPQMWLHPPIARNVAQLRADGCWVIDPGLGAPVARRQQVGVGALGFDVPGLVRALDAVLTRHAADRSPA